MLLRSLRHLLGVWSMAVMVGWLPGSAGAQPPGWPDRPLKLIVPYAPGGGTDIIARAVASKLSTRLGQPVVVDNRSGAGGSIGIETGVRAAPDGYTLLFVTGAYATLVAAGRKLPYDPIKDIAPIAQVGSTPLLVVVAIDQPIKTLRDLVELSRAKPGAVNYGSSGIGSMSHLGMELLAAEAKVQLTHIPYKGMAPAMTDLIAGTLQAGVMTFATASSFIEAGKARVLAVTGSERSPYLPKVPTTAEAGYPGFRIDFWWGLVAPARVPSSIVDRLNAEINGILGQPDMRELLAREGGVPTPLRVEEFGKSIEQAIARWTRLVQERNIQAQ
jgi:tripartite-type tricarboxylate transporter receptor subunit TctC